MRDAMTSPWLQSRYFSSSSSTTAFPTAWLVQVGAVPWLEGVAVAPGGAGIWAGGEIREVQFLRYGESSVITWETFCQLGLWRAKLLSGLLGTLLYF